MGNQDVRYDNYLSDLNDNASLDIKAVNLLNDIDYIDILNDLSIDSKYFDETTFVNARSPNKVSVLSINLQSLQAKYTEFKRTVHN